MKKNLIILVALMTVLISSCGPGNYGKKVTISDRTTVYIKGDGVTEADAKKLGTFIDTTYKDVTNSRAFQLSKDSGLYVIKMPVDEAKIKKDPSLEVSFMALQLLFEMQVFPGSKVKLVLTDEYFKDIKTIKGSTPAGIGVDTAKNNS